MDRIVLEEDRPRRIRRLGLVDLLRSVLSAAHQMVRITRGRIMEAVTAGELNIREAFLQDAVKQLQDRLTAIDKLREAPHSFDSFELRVFEKNDKKMLTRFYGHGNDPLIDEIFRPLIEQGLTEYRKRLQAYIYETNNC